MHMMHFAYDAFHMNVKQHRIGRKSANSLLTFSATSNVFFIKSSMTFCTRLIEVKCSTDL